MGLLLRQIRYTDCDDKEVERSMFAAVFYFRGAYDRYGYEDWKRNIEAFFSYFDLTSNQKYFYAQRKLNEEAYW